MNGERRRGRMNKAGVGDGDRRSGEGKVNLNEENRMGRGEWRQIQSSRWMQRWAG